MALIDKLTAIADGFRASRGTTQAYTLDEMAELAAVPLGSGTAPEDLTAELTEQEELIEELMLTLAIKAAGGGDEVTQSIVNRTITTYADGDVTSIGSYAFCGCTKLTQATIPAVKSTATYAFSGCTSLTKVVGAIETLGSYIYNGCTKLVDIDTSKLTSIGTYAFQNCSALGNLDLPLVTAVGAYAFKGATKITHMALPSLKSMVNNAFRNASFATVDMPVLTSLASYGFRDCTKLTEAKFPAVTASSTEAMRGCTALTKVDLPVITSVGASTFYGCSKLQAVILRNTAKVATLSNVNAFTNSSVKSGGTGYIYVPRTMDDGSDGVAAYQAATNWSSFASQFRAIEDYPEICG